MNKLKELAEALHRCAEGQTLEDDAQTLRDAAEMLEDIENYYQLKSYDSYEDSIKPFADW